MRSLTVLASILVVGSLSVVSAQQGQGGGGGPRQRMSVEDRVAELKTQLTLTADQATKITAVMQKQRDTMQVLRDKFGDDRDGMREAMKPVRENSDKAIMALLTDVQKKKYEEIIAQRGQGGRGPGAPKDSTKAAPAVKDSTKTPPPQKGK
jgi:periplasmic protein CpxP/Spy